jgi:hypothetical protein
MSGWFARLGATGHDRRGLRFWEVIAIASYMIGTAGIGVYGAAVPDGLRAFAILEMVAGAAWGSGAVLGFLFGVPRLRSSTGPQAGGGNSQFTPNTNLEQISDWLTKIIVGATLVQLNAVVARIQTTAEVIGASIGATHGGPVAGATMIYFFTAGFMWGYLWCSLRIFREMIQMTGQDMASRAKAQDTPPPTTLAAGDGEP